MEINLYFSCNKENITPKAMPKTLPNNILKKDLPITISKEFQVISLIEDFRKRGHLFTKTNPVRERREYLPKLDIENFNLIAQRIFLHFEKYLII